jgi:hypothetical protein
MSTFFTAAGPGEPDEHPSAHGDEIGAMHFIAKETASDERALRRSLFSAPEDTVPSFGTGGVVSASGSVISPTR